MKTNHFKTFGLLSVALWTICSCAPGVQLIDVEKRLAPSHPVELSNKSIAVFSALDGKSDSTLISDLAQGIATSLEKRLSREDGSIFAFNVRLDSTTVMDDEFIKDLSVRSNSDLVFILSSVKLNDAGIYLNKVPSLDYHATYVQLPFNLLLDVFDGVTAVKQTSVSMKDTLVWEIVSRNQLKESVLNVKLKEAFSGAASDIGESVTINFFESWKKDSRALYYFLGQKWEESITAARDFNWEKASRIWLEAVGSSNKHISACAAYNLAVVCELQDRKDLALKWLDYAKKRYPLTLVEGYETFLKK